MKLIKKTDAGLLKFSNLTAVAGNVLAEMLEIKHFEMKKIMKKTIKAEKKRREHSQKIGDGDLVFKAVFRDWEYEVNSRKFPTLIMNEDALYLVIANVSSAKSAKAHELKVWFKSEFNKMRLERSFRNSSKKLHNSFSDEIQNLYIRLKDVGSSMPNEGRLHMIFAKKINKALFGKQIDRDTLTDRENGILFQFEAEIAVELQRCTKEHLTAYEVKDEVYQFIKNKKGMR